MEPYIAGAELGSDNLADHESADALLAAEWRNYIRNRRRSFDDSSGAESDDPPDDLTGLALSGGGIRSAIFSLGVIQALAKHRALERFDYLSAVSGGGYMGGSLTYHANRAAPDQATQPLGKDFVYGDDATEFDTRPGDRSAALSYLRNRGRYLTPTSKLNAFSFGGAVFRAMFLNLFVWIPIALLAMAAAQRLTIGIATDTGSFTLTLAGIGSIATALLAEYWRESHASDSRSFYRWRGQFALYARDGLLLFFGGLLIKPTSIATTDTSPLVADLLDIVGTNLDGFLIGAIGAFIGARFISDLTQGKGVGRQARRVLSFLRTAAWFYFLAIAWFVLIAIVYTDPDTLGQDVIHKAGEANTNRHAPWCPTVPEASVSSLGTQRSPADMNEKPLDAETIVRLTCYTLTDALSSEFWRNESSMVFRVIGALSTVCLVAVVLFSILYSLRTGFEYTWRFGAKYLRVLRFGRFVDRWVYGTLLKRGLVLLAIASIPIVSIYAESLGGTLIFATGAAAAAWNLYSKSGKWIPPSVMARAAALLLVYGLAIAVYSAAAWNLDSEGFDLLIYLSAASLVLGYFVNVNLTSVGRYYRNRLMEAFMPDPADPADRASAPPSASEPAKPSWLQRTGSLIVAVFRRHRTTTGSASVHRRDEPADTADRFNLATIAARCVGQSPYHLINTLAIFDDSDNARVGMRGGDNFILSPLYCGSSTTGWRESQEFLNGNLSLATAVAASAAAVNPRAGIGGSGVTRSRAISFLMALLNIRLGSWVPNPRERHGASRMNHFWAALYELSPIRGFRETSRYITISDGGHFENLALYELVRRRLETIVVVDAGADPNFDFDDLQNALARIEDDFGTEVRLIDPLATLIPKGETQHYPRDVQYANAGFIRATLVYPSNEAGGEAKKGTLYLIKTTMIRRLPMSVRAYKNTHRDFPDESTADQFFGEVQFEAYRRLGYQLGEQLLVNSTLKQDLGVPEPT